MITDCHFTFYKHNVFLLKNLSEQMYVKNMNKRHDPICVCLPLCLYPVSLQTPSWVPQPSDSKHLCSWNTHFNKMPSDQHLHSETVTSVAYRMKMMVTFEGVLLMMSEAFWWLRPYSTWPFICDDETEWRNLFSFK